MAAENSFDIACKIDMQEVTNALDQGFSQLKSELRSEIALELRSEIAASAAGVK